MKIFVFILLLLPGIILHAQDVMPSTGSKNQKESPVVARRTDPFLQSIAVSDSGVQRLIVWMNALEVQINAERPGKGMTTQSANLNLSKSNINKAKGPIDNVSKALNKLKASDPANRSTFLNHLLSELSTLDAPVNDLYNSLLSSGANYAAKAAELKEKHDTVKNAIQNIR
jgi:hypothetical protein